MTSLRARLLVSLLAMVVLVGAAAAWFAYRNALAQSATFFDYQLRQTAMILRDQPYQFLLFPVLPSGRSSYDFIVQVWRHDGVRMFFSRPYEAVPGIAPEGFSDVQTGDYRWRVFGLRTEDAIIQVAQPMDARARLARGAAARSLSPFLLLVPLLGMLVWLIVGRALEPMRKLASDVASRPTLALNPLPEEHLPDEVRPLVRALNDLLDRLRAAIERERAFLADAAHELRTPLAALSLQIDALRGDTDVSRDQSIEKLAMGLRRNARLVEQLLAFARQDARSPKTFAPVALDVLARDVVTEAVGLADERDIDVGVAEERPVIVHGDADALRTLLRNLLDNAVRYTPRGGRVDVSVRTHPERERAAVIEVLDTGPGIPAADRPRALERFQRLGASEEPGSGLGLAIVKAIAEAHGARLVLDSGPQGAGLAVRVEFPENAVLSSS